MKMFLRLLRAESKRMAGRIPGIVARAAVMILALGVLAVCAVKTDSCVRRVSPFTIGYSVEEGDQLGAMAVFYIEHMESMAGLCQFVQVEPEEGEMMLERGSIAAYIRFPPQFVEKIIDGTNEPVLIQMPSKPTVETALFQDVAKAGAEMLSVSQAEIYASYSLAERYGQPEWIPQMQDDINAWNIRLTLNREELFREQVLSAIGQATALEYAAASALVFCLFLLGIPCCGFLIPEPEALTRMLSRAGAAVWQQALAKYLVMTAVLCLFSLVYLMGINIGGHYGSPMSVNLGSPTVWRGILSVCLCVASILIWCCHMAPQETSAVLLIFWLSMLLLFLSGGFLPSVFLPESLRTVAGYLPGVWMLREISGLFTWNYEWRYPVILLGFSLLFFCLTIAGEYLRRSRRR